MEAIADRLCIPNVHLSPPTGVSESSDVIYDWLAAPLARSDDKHCVIPISTVQLLLLPPCMVIFPIYSVPFSFIH